MLALHEKELKYSRSTVPPVEVFRKWGPMMPAISINGESWFLESKEILHRLGYSPVTEEDMENIRKAWTGVMHRADYWPRFWGEFSLASDPNPKFVVRFIKNFFVRLRLCISSPSYEAVSSSGDTETLDAMPTHI